MIDAEKKDYIAVVQCHTVKERCPGYYCEYAFSERTGGFSPYPKDKAYRMLAFTCGGCPGRATHRKLSMLLRKIKLREGINKNRIVVHLSSCMTKESYHGLPCPHLDYIKDLVAKLGLDVCEDTRISDKAEARRKAGIYATKK